MRENAGAVGEGGEFVNHVVNDSGKTVPAWGAPGSVARAECEHPKLIEEVNALYWSAYESPGRAVDEAIERIRRAGIVDERETASILMASHYQHETTDSVTGIVMRFTCNRKKSTREKR